MFSNYLAAALRNLARNRLYAGINIVGLAVGFAAAILIALFVRDEFSYDTWIPGYERTYRVTTFVSDFRGQAFRERSDTFRSVAEWLKLDFPQIEAVARLYGREVKLRHGDVEGIEQTAIWADPGIFSVLPLKSIAGDLNTALQKPDGIVSTRAMARKYFGRDTPLGETIELDRQHPMQVTAVIEDLPSNTHLDAEIFMSGRASFSALTALDAAHFSPDREPFTMLEAVTYVRLAKRASIDELRREIPAFLERHPEQQRLLGKVDMGLRPIASLHLQNAVYASEKPPADLAAIYAVSGIAILIVLVASINYVNLMTARAGRRAVEVGIRKVAGAGRQELISQFIGESLIYVSLGMAIAVALVELSLPSLNGFLDRRIAFEFWRDPILICAIAGTALMVGILGGFYPAFVLSAFQPVAVLKGGIAHVSGSGTVRQTLVVLQFAILIGLILATGIVYRQTEFAVNENLRLDKDQVLTINNACIPTLKDELRKVPGILATACSWGAVDGGGVPVSAVSSKGVSASGLMASPVDFGFLELYGLKPLAGRFVSDERGGDHVSADPNSATNPAVVINETAVRQLGFPSPEAAIGQTILWKRMLVSRKFMVSALPSEIIGVVPDFSMYIRRVIRPTFYYADPAMSEASGYEFFDHPQALNVKLSGRNVPEALNAIDRLWRQLGEQGRPIDRSFIDQQLQKLYLDVTRQAKLFAAFAGIAVFIACLGLFGLSAFTAERRTKEIGIRKAMGANRWDIVKLLVWQFLKPVLLANLIAWPVGYYFMNRWLHGFAYHVDLSPWVFLASGASALVIALATVSVHAFIVAGARPVAALRYE